MSNNNCPRCGVEVEPNESLCEDGPHYAKAICPDCGRFLYFIGKPENKTQLEKRPNGCPTPAKLDIDYCQLCLRHKEKIGKGYLETHHIDGNPANNDRLNHFIVCIGCHKLIHWMRTYIKNHMED
jgi:hypothetical protein